MREPLTTPCGVKLAVGQRWRELDGRFLSRTVTVMGWNSETLKVKLKGVRNTHARLDRFNGKRGGYILVTEARP